MALTCICAIGYTRLKVPSTCRLWSFPDDCCSDWRLTKPPLTTSFCQGFGSKLFAKGHCMSRGAWFNLHKQQLQPRDQGNLLCQSCCSVKLHTEDAYNGGGCLRVLFKSRREHPDVEPYVRLFGCDFPLGPLAVTYTFKNISNCVRVGHDIAIVLKARNAAGEAEETYLGITVGLPDGYNYAVTRKFTRGPEDDVDDPKTCWVTRKYKLEDLRGASDQAVLQEVGLRFSCVNEEAVVCLLGQLDIRRPDDAKSAVTDDSSSDDEPEGKRLREERYGFDAVPVE